MNRQRQPLLIPLALAALACCALCSCAKTSGGNHGPGTSTETGNPPFVDPLRVSLLVSAGDVSIVGEPGAVTPGGSEVEVEVVSTGETFRVKAEADGSFKISVKGSEDDVYLVRGVPVDGGEPTTPVYVYRGGAKVGTPDGETLSCEVRDAVVDGVLDAAYAAVDSRCRIDSDCTHAPSVDGCFYGPHSCGTPPVSRVAAEQLKATLDALQRSVCDGGYEDQECWKNHPPPGCPGQPPTQLVCADERCIECFEGSSDPACSGKSEALTCEQRDQAIADAIDPILDKADLSCEVDSDCVFAPPIKDCYHGSWLCYPPVVTQSVADELQAAADALYAPVCSGYAEAGCWNGKAVPDCIQAWDPFCNAGTCELCVDEACKPKPPEPSPCAPQVAEYSGGCEAAPRYYWTGNYCQGISGCDCKGPDCDNGYGSEEECTAAHEGCADDVRGCGGFLGPTCADDEYCAYLPGQYCGGADASATCQPRPTACDTVYDPICGCDGTTYENSCVAATKGTGILHLGECP